MKAECNQGQVLGFPHTYYNIPLPLASSFLSPNPLVCSTPSPFPPYHSETSHIPLVISSPLTYSLKSGPCAPPSFIGGLYAPLPILVSLRPPSVIRGPYAPLSLLVSNMLPIPLFVSILTSSLP